MELNTQELMLIEQRVTNSSKSVGVAYLFWFFLFWLSAHRFYLGRPVSAIIQIISYFVLIGFVWALVDAFLIPSMVRQHQNETRERLIRLLRAEKGARLDTDATAAA